MQLDHHQIANHQPSREISIFCDGVNSPENIGLIVRLADAFGAKDVHFFELEEIPKKARKIGRSCFDWINVVCHPDKLDLKQFPAAHFVALEYSSKSIPLAELSSSSDPIGIVIGNEKHGIGEDTLSSIEHHAHIPMFGKNTSINVGTALAIALYHFQA